MTRVKKSLVLLAALLAAFSFAPLAHAASVIYTTTDLGGSEVTVYSDGSTTVEGGGGYDIFQWNNQGGNESGGGEITPINILAELQSEFPTANSAYLCFGTLGGGGNPNCNGNATTSPSSNLYSWTSNQLFLGSGGLGDGNTNTHVIDISEPALYATTTSATPANINFTIYNNSTQEANGYQITYQNTNTFQATYQYGWLADVGYVSPTDDNEPFGISTTSPILSDGPYKISVVLFQGQPDNPIPTQTNPSAYFNPSTVSYFGIGSSTDFTLIPSFSSSSFSYSSTSCAINFSGSFSLSDCLGYIFLPSSNGLSGYGSLETEMQGKFPFAYPFSIATAWGNLVASTTANSPTFNFNLANASTSQNTAIGNLLPNFQGFGASTTMEWFPSGTFATMKGLAEVAIWAGFFVYVFFDIQHMMLHI